jgi:manganese transport protein
MVGALSAIFTQTLGSWSEIVFLIGAFFALYSTLFTATASWARLWGDAFSQLGWIKFTSSSEQKKAIGIFSWVFPVTWCLLFWFVQAPVMMVILGGVATSVLLLLVVWAALIFRYQFLPDSLRPTLVYDVFLWLSVISVLAISTYSLIQILS